LYANLSILSKKEKHSMNLITKLKIATAGTVLLAMGAVQVPAQAALFSFNFGGRDITGRIGDTIGGEITGNIIFDDSIPDTNPDPLKGQYLGAIVEYTININGARTSQGDTFTYEVIQGSSGSVIVGLAIDGVGACGLTVNCLAFLLGSNVFPLSPLSNPSNFDLHFTYPAGSLLSDALPVVVPATGGEPLLRSDERQFSFTFDAFATVVPVTSTSVPESSTIGGLFFLGLGFFFRKRVVFSQKA
jgi:hypothetical protein